VTEYAWRTEPNTSGWYVAVCCWDASEGLIPMISRWNGGWREAKERPIVGHAGPFATAEEADVWLDENDPEG
jgi:hypothetical protein